MKREEMVLMIVVFLHFPQDISTAMETSRPYFCQHHIGPQQ